VRKSEANKEVHIVNEAQFNRGSWLVLGAASILILTVLGVNAYRFTLPTNGWVYDGFGGGFSTDLLVLQNLLQALTGQSQSPAVIVISTLAIAALFNPLRKRIQNEIDRRFYRRKYDAEQTLEAFTASLRQEVDLDAINRSLLAVTMEALQPENASLWLRDPGEVKG
jgi:hypothetical protein